MTTKDENAGDGAVPGIGGHHGVREAMHHTAAGAARLTSALARPVSLVRTQRRNPRQRPAGTATGDAVVACGIYRDGRNEGGAVHHTDALRTVRMRGEGFAWLGLYEPQAGQLTDIAKVFDLHPLAVEDAIHAHQRPKLERYGDTLFMVLKTARYVEHDTLTSTSEVVETGEVMVFLGGDFVVTVRHGEHGGLKALRNRLEGEPDRLAMGPSAVLHAIADQIVDDYIAVSEAMQDDIDEIERYIFARGVQPDAGRVYQLKRETLEFKHAVLPLAAPLRALADGSVSLVPVGVREYFRDVADHLEQVIERINGFDELLGSILSATLTQVTIAQNEDMRRISAWVAIAAVPTMIAGIYGMNFSHMPELNWTWSYPAVLIAMASICGYMYRSFKRNGWL